MRHDLLPGGVIRAMSTAAAPAATRTGAFYGWRVLSVMFASQMVAVGGVSYAYSLFVKPIGAELGASRGQLSWGMIGLMIVLMLAGPFVGRALDRYSIRHIVAAGGLLLAAGFCLMSISSSLLALALCFWIPVGLGHLVAGPATASKLVAAWFERRRGLALGISAVGTSAGGFVAPPLIAAAMAAWGWRGALAAIGLVSAIVIVPAALAVIVNRPQDIGLRPDGDLPLDGERAAHAPELWSIRRSLTHPAYWGLALGFGAPFAIGGGLLSFLHAYGTDHGLSATAAAWLISLLAGASVVGKLLFGALADWIPARTLTWTGIAFQAAFLWLLMGEPSVATLFGAAVIGGLSFGGLLPLHGVMIAAAFGPASFASLMGLMAPVITPLLIAAFWISGFMYSEEHGYQPVLELLLIGSAVAAAALLLVRSRGPGAGRSRTA
jgi:MFS family permease